MCNFVVQSIISFIGIVANIMHIGMRLCVLNMDGRDYDILHYPCSVVIGL